MATGDSEGQCPDGIREQLARACRQKHLRSVPAELPCRWSPSAVVRPDGGLNDPLVYFAGPGAWEWTADLLEDGHVVQLMRLRRPPDKTGYVLKYTVPTTAPEGAHPQRTIYIKLQQAPGSRVYGRSFHYSEPGWEDDDVET